MQVLAAACLFSTGGAAIKATVLTGWQVASFRSGVAAIVLLALMPSARKGWSRGTVLVAMAYAGTLTCFVLANKLTTAANTIFLQSTAPLYLALLGPLLLKESTRRRDLAFMVALAAGLLMVFFGTEPARATAADPTSGNLLAVASGVFWALTVTGMRFMATREASGGATSASAVVLGNLIAFGVGLPFALPVITAHATDWAVIAFLGTFQIGLAYALLTVAFRKLRALEASLLLLLEPVLNPVWAAVFHAERPGHWSLAGGVVILVATLIQANAPARR